MIDLLLSSKWIFLFYIRKYSKSGEGWIIRITRLSNNSYRSKFQKEEVACNDILDESELWLNRCGIKTSIVSILTIFDRVNCEARWLESGKSIKVSCTCLSMGQKTRRIFFFFSYWILSCGKCAKFWERKRTLPRAKILILIFYFSHPFSHLLKSFRFVCQSKKKIRTYSSRFFTHRDKYRGNFQRYSIYRDYKILKFICKLRSQVSSKFVSRKYILLST